MPIDLKTNGETHNTCQINFERIRFQVLRNEEEIKEMKETVNEFSTMALDVKEIKAKVNIEDKVKDASGFLANLTKSSGGGAGFAFTLYVLAKVDPSFAKSLIQFLSGS